MNKMKMELETTFQTNFAATKFTPAIFRQNLRLTLTVLMVFVPPLFYKNHELFLPVSLFFVLMLIIVSLTDFLSGYVFDVCLCPLALAGIVCNFLGLGQSPFSAFWGAAVGGGMFALIRVLSRGGMGGGDVKFACVLGLWLPWSSWLSAMYIAFGFGTLVALYHRFRHQGQSIPFAPFMSLGAYVMLITA